MHKMLINQLDSPANRDRYRSRKGVNLGLSKALLRNIFAVHNKLSMNDLTLWQRSESSLVSNALGPGSLSQLGPQRPKRGPSAFAT